MNNLYSVVYFEIPILPEGTLNNPYDEDEDEDVFNYNDNSIKTCFIGTASSCKKFINDSKKDIEHWKNDKYTSTKDYILRNGIRIFEFVVNRDVTSNEVIKINDFYNILDKDEHYDHKTVNADDVHNYVLSYVPPNSTVIKQNEEICEYSISKLEYKIFPTINECIYCTYIINREYTKQNTNIEKCSVIHIPVDKRKIKKTELEELHISLSYDEEDLIRINSNILSNNWNISINTLDDQIKTLDSSRFDKVEKLKIHLEFFYSKKMNLVLVKRLENFKEFPKNLKSLVLSINDCAAYTGKTILQDYDYLSHLEKIKHIEVFVECETCGCELKLTHSTRDHILNCKDESDEESG